VPIIRPPSAARRLATLAMASGGAVGSSGAAGAAALDLDRVRASLWGMHVGDALAMPVHWYYNLGQLSRDFGSIQKYEAPKERLPGSIMSLSNTGGAGRGSDAGTIVGDVILHGKRKFWKRGEDYHYHRGMHAGENTLEVTITRECFMASLSEKGAFDREDVRDRYVRLMTTPGSHNDVRLACRACLPACLRACRLADSQTAGACACAVCLFAHADLRGHVPPHVLRQPRERQATRRVPG
jgi:hypothetical protein